MLLGISNGVDAQTTTNLENLAEILPANAATLQLINAFATRPSDIGKTHFYTRMSINREGNTLAVEYQELDARLPLSTAIQLWDLSTITLVQTLDMDEDISDFRLSPNGDYLGIRKIGGPTSLWDIRINTEVLFEAEGDHIRFSDNGQYFAYKTNEVITASSSEEYIVVFDLTLNEEVARIPANSPVFDLRFSPDSSRIAAVGLDGLVRVWDIPSGTNEPSHIIGKESTGSTFEVYFSNDSQFLTYIHLLGELYTINLANGDEVYQTSCDAMRRFTYGKENGSVFATCPDGVLRLVNVQTFAVSPPLEIEKYWDINYSETILLSSDNDNSLELLDIENGEILKTLDFGEQIISARFSPNGELLVVIGNSGKVSLFGVL